MLNKKALSATAQVEKDGDFKNTVLLLHGDGTNGAQNNTFTDSSTNNFTITRNGNTTQGTFSPFSVADGEWSNYFNSTTQQLRFADSTAFDLANDFTIEFWVYPTAVANNPYFVCLGDSAATNNGFLIYYSNSTSSLRFYVNGAAVLIGSSLSNNQWYHVAVVRSGSSTNNLKMYLNGVQDAQATNTVSYTGVAGNGFVIGAEYNASTFGGNGFFYMSNCRLVKGTAVYTGAFTPPTTPLTAITNTSLLTCQSNRFVDNSTNALAVTVNSTPSVQPFSPFAPSAAYSASTNGGSGYFDGTDDCLDVATTTLNPRTDSFTTEGWFYVTSTSGNRTLVGSTSNSLFYISYLPGTTLLAVGDGTTNTIEVTVSALPYSWNYFAISFDGTTYRAYINGTRVQESTTLLASNSVNLTVGARNSGSFRMLGYLSDVRHVKGSALYTGSTMTVPTAPLSTVSGTEFLLKFQGAGIIDSTAKNVLETVGNAQIDTTTKKFGTGSMKFDGTGDYLVAPASSINSLGSGDFTIECWVYPSIVDNNAICGLGNVDNTDTSSFFLRLENGYVNFYTTGNNRNSVSYTSGSWYHLAVVRSSGTLNMYWNGTQIGSGISITNNFSSTDFYVASGKVNGTVPYNAFNGYIDDLRITKGVARYTANFTVPSKAFADQ